MNKKSDFRLTTVRDVTRVWALLIVLLTQPVFAERHALLVGIGNYPESMLDLDGPEHDLNALEPILIDTWQFKRSNIQVLRDSQATKEEILKALVRLKERSKPGDQLFFYFSGHGTSAGDDNIQLPLPDMTAGLLPYDVKLNLSKPEIISSLIVGRTDLRPLFQDIDQSGRELLVMIDACYSGNAVRSFSSATGKPPSRFVRLDASVDTLLPESDQIQTRAIATAASEQAYPYENVFFISASGEYEEAADISGPFLQKFPTIDGKPHGAFSDAMLRALSGKAGYLDTDNNAVISHLEIKQGIQEWLSGKFPQTPQHLPPIEEDVRNLASRGVFGYKTLPGTIVKAKQGVQPNTEQGTLAMNSEETTAVALPQVVEEARLKLSIDPNDAQLATIRAQFNARQDIVLTSIYPDLQVVAEVGGVIALRNGANDLIIRFPVSMGDEVVHRIEQEVRLHQFFLALRKQKAFEMSLDVAGKQNNGPHLEGEFVQFSVRSGRNAWIVLLDIDREGGINILFPAFNHEQRLQPRSLVLQTPEIEIVPPFGTDRIIALGFSERPIGLLSWLGELTPRISPRTDRLNEFLEMIAQYRDGLSLQELDFITAQNPS
ncbi:MAG: caspase family protein [Acidiferrobacterales bacterium]|nr:caspase family protein [Acidiferrobacterales bacterium]